MSDRPFYIDTTKFIMDTQHLTTAGIGAYALLMAACATRGSVQNSNRHLAAITKSSLRHWRKLRPCLEQLFVITPDAWSLPRPHQRKQISTALARRVREKTGDTCHYCDTPFSDDPTSDRRATVDHVFPVSRGGTNAFENLVTACWRCNRSKSDMLVHEWMEAEFA